MWSHVDPRPGQTHDNNAGQVPCRTLCRHSLQIRARLRCLPKPVSVDTSFVLPGPAKMPILAQGVPAQTGDDPYSTQMTMTTTVPKNDPNDHDSEKPVNQRVWKQFLKHFHEHLDHLMTSQAKKFATLAERGDSKNFWHLWCDLLEKAVIGYAEVKGDKVEGIQGHGHVRIKNTTIKATPRLHTDNNTTTTQLTPSTVLLVV